MKIKLNKLRIFTFGMNKTSIKPGFIICKLSFTMFEKAL